MSRKLLFSIILLLIISIGLAYFMQQVTRPMGFGDAKRYLSVAQQPGVFTRSPWGYRIAVPYTANLLSTITQIGLLKAFDVIQIALFSIFFTVLLLWLRHGLNISSYSVLLTAVIFLFSYAGIYNLHNRVHVGYGEYLLILLGSIAIYYDRYWILFILLAASCFVKETVGLLLIPTYFVSSLLKHHWSLVLAKTALLGLIFTSLSFLLRSGFLFRLGGGFDAYSSFYNQEYILSVYQYWGGVRGGLTQIAYTFGPAWLLALAGFIVAPKRLKVFVVLPLLACIQILLGTDVYRMVSVGAPIILVFCAITLDHVNPKIAPLLAGLSVFYFISWNHQVGMKAAFISTVVTTIVLLVWDRVYESVRKIPKC